MVTGIWIDYIRLESEHPDGNAESAAQIHFRALRRLEGEANEKFVTQHTLLQTGHINWKSCFEVWSSSSNNLIVLKVQFSPRSWFKENLWMFSIRNAILITCYIDQWRDTKIFVWIFLNYQNLQYLSVCEIQRQKFINKAIFRPSVFICFIMKE